MPSKKRISNSTSGKGSTDAKDESLMIRFNQTLLKEHFRHLSGLTKSLGMQYEQDVVRIAVADFLRRRGLVE